MSGLRTLLQYAGGGSGASIDYDTIYIYDPATISNQQNGGTCCLYTVPAGNTWFGVELWGAGGSGAGVCCCFGGWAGGSGSYTRKIIGGLAGGETYTICAGGSGCCTYSTTGCVGYPSYIYDITAATNVACASGGSPGGSRCRHHISCSYQGCGQHQCGSTCGTMSICGVTGSSKGNSYCTGGAWNFMPSAPFTGNAMARPSKDGCSGMCGGCCNGGYATFPGGGGPTSFSHTTGPFYGGPGGAGMIIIYSGSTA